MSTPRAATEAAASIKPATGKLGVMIPGMGAVATTLIAGVEAVRRGFAKPRASLSQMGHIRLGKRTENRSPLIKDVAPIADLHDIVFTGWDIFGGNLYDAAKTAQVLDRDQLEQIRPYLESIEPMPAVFDQHYVKRLTAKKIKTGKNKCDLANQIRNDIAEFKTRMLGVSGWYSTNILGNRDGEVLDDPESFKTKEESKLGVLDVIFQPELYPDLYKDLYHKVRINYYPPRGDNKEGWDNIDIFGWLGYPMQLKVDFLCRDSILAAPLALDLVLFMDLAAL